MPVANCVVCKDCYQRVNSNRSLIALWADESGKSAQHMSVNIIEAVQQQGNACPILANLYLPSLWSEQDIDALQTGLAKALARYFEVAVSQVLVITSIVDSGRVVENGQVERW